MMIYDGYHHWEAPGGDGNIALEAVDPAVANDQLRDLITVNSLSIAVGWEGAGYP